MNGIDRSPAELLCNRHFRTNISMIQHASDLSHKARLHNEDSTKYQTGSKALVPIPIGSRIFYDSNPDSSKAKRPEWSKGTIKNIEEPGHKYNH